MQETRHPQAAVVRGDGLAEPVSPDFNYQWPLAGLVHDNQASQFAPNGLVSQVWVNSDWSAFVFNPCDIHEFVPLVVI
jgi:hypothetical protein